MCLAIPGLVEELFEENGLRMARVSFGGVRRSVCLEYTPQASQGAYVLVHVGFALSVIDEREAGETLSLLRQMGTLQDDISELREPGVELQGEGVELQEGAVAVQESGVRDEVC